MYQNPQDVVPVPFRLPRGSPAGLRYGIVPKWLRYDVMKSALHWQRAPTA